MKPTRLGLAGLTIGIAVVAFAMEPRTAGQAGAQGQTAVQGAPPAQPQGRQGGRGGRGGGGAPARKRVLAWADTRNGQAQHESVGHALAVIEKLGYEGLWDTFIRTDSHIISKAPKKTDGSNASGGPNLSNVDAIFFMGTAKSHLIRRSSGAAVLRS
jgi:hypothetical protein